MTGRPTPRAQGSAPWACTALLCVLAATPSRAQQPQPAEGPALELGLRTGLLLAFGDDFKGLGPTASSRYQSFVPAELDLGVRFASGLFLGAYFQYSAGLGKTCATGATCSAHLIRFGADALFHLRPRAAIDPWVGVGTGYGIGTFSQAPAGVQTTNTLRGLELFHLQGGVDFRVAPALRIGPFLQFALGRYTVAKASQGGIDFTADIQNQSLHELLTLGVRGAFELMFL
jgi:outer membrane protein